MRKRWHAGFTLIELLVVIAIIAAMVTISVPAIAAFASPKETLRKEGRRLMALMNEARQVAMSRKVRVDIRIDPAMNEIRAVESYAYRSLMAGYPDGIVDREDLEWIAAMSNRFERVVPFRDELVLEGFSIDEIDPPFDENEMFQRRDMPGRNLEYTEEPEAETVALTFTQYGGSDGGGITFYFKERSLNIAADILTGRPKLVNRRVLDL